jgi:hypothetical protein
VRIIKLFICGALLIVYPVAARGQSLDVHGSAGPTVTDAGYSVAAGIGVAPTSRLGFSIGVESTHLSTRIDRGPDSVSYFRGGTYLLGTGELQFAPRGRGRVGPFALVGFTAGISRPNVNDVFPTPVTNLARAVFGGGGVLVPLSAQLTVFADARMLIGSEGNDGLVAVAPLRAGIAWRF